MRGVPGRSPETTCSRVCCPTALKQALWLKKQKPDLQVYILYRDMMTCGLTEAWYTRAREQGVLFFQYHPDRKPQVSVNANENAPVLVRLYDPILDAPVEIAADLLVLATGIQPNLPETLALAYGVERDHDGFFLEADSKWRPVEALKTGVFGCGIALSPRSIPETVATAEAAAGRAPDHSELPSGCRPPGPRPSCATACAPCACAASIRVPMTPVSWTKPVGGSRSTRPCARGAATVPPCAPTVHRLWRDSPTAVCFGAIDGAMAM